MDDGPEELNATFEPRKRFHFVFGSPLPARTERFKFLWILIVMSITQYSSTAWGADWLRPLIQNDLPERPAVSLLDWSASTEWGHDALSNLNVTGWHAQVRPHHALISVNRLFSGDTSGHSRGMGVETKGLLHDSESRATERLSIALATQSKIQNPKSKTQNDCCDLFSRHAFSKSRTTEKPEIPWSRWDDDLTACEFATHDFATLIGNLDNDFVALWELENVAFVGAGLGLSLGLRDSVDEDVRQYTAQHPGRWGGFSEALSVLGNTEYQLAGIAVLYGYAYHRRDDDLMDFTRLLVRSYTMTGLSTLLIKGIANTDRPSDRWNNGQFGFPSAHVSTSFAIAATIEEYYGPQAGIPAYLTAGLIGWSRIDERDHDLSDVVFGAVLGYAIAKSIAGQELRDDPRIRMFPWTDPGNKSLGAMWEIEF